MPADAKTPRRFCVFLRAMLLASVAISEVFLPARAASLDKEFVQGWLSPSNFYSRIQIEISQNFFFPDDNPSFTKEPGEMVVINGALLPNSFYIKFPTNAYPNGRAFVDGESDSNYWSCSEYIAYASKNPAQGGSLSNSVTRDILFHKRLLQAWTPLGFLNVEPGSFEINNAEFTAKGIDGKPIKGHFNSVDDFGRPISFTYEWDNSQRISARGEIDYLNQTNRKYECTVGLWRNNQFWKTVRVKIDELAEPNETDLTLSYKPSDFLGTTGVISRVIFESNRIRYDVLPAGELQPIDIPTENRSPSRVGWVVTVAFLVVTGVLVLRFSKNKNQQQK